MLTVIAVLSLKAPDTCRRPVIVVAPVYVLVPDKVKVPEPAFVKLPSPEITPEIVSFPASPVVNVTLLAIWTAPEPDNELIVSVVSTS